MDEGNDGDKEVDLQQVFRSDLLPAIRTLLTEPGQHSERDSSSSTHLVPYQMSIILDANAVLDDLRWLADKRENPEARTDLLETLDAGTVVAIAPKHLETEVQKHINSLSDRYRIPKGELEEVWKELAERINFVDVPKGLIEVVRSRIEVTDPKDLPYIALQWEIGVPIYSADEDIAEMGEEVISENAISSLKRYSRSASVHGSVTLGGSLTFQLIGKFLSATYSGSTKAIEALRELPRWLQIALGLSLAGGAGYALYKPEARRKIQNFLEEAGSVSYQAVKTIGCEALVPVLLQAGEEIQEARKRLSDAKSEFEVELPRHALERKLEDFQGNHEGT
jgi:predicted nucleic acid-binding protein